MLKIHVHEGRSILISWEGAKGCRGAGILSAPAMPGCAHPSFPLSSTLLFPLITDHSEAS